MCEMYYIYNYTQILIMYVYMYVCAYVHNRFILRHDWVTAHICAPNACLYDLRIDVLATRLLIRCGLLWILIVYSFIAFALCTCVLFTHGDKSGTALIKKS